MGDGASALRWTTLGERIAGKLFTDVLNGFSVVDEVEVHGILGAEWGVVGYGLGNLTVRFYGFCIETVSGCFNKERDGAVDYGNQAGNDYIFAAHGYGGVEFDVFLSVVFVFL